MRSRAESIRSWLRSRKGNTHGRPYRRAHHLVVILVLYLVNMLPLDGRTKQIVQVIVIIIGVISLLKYLAVF